MPARSVNPVNRAFVGARWGTSGRAGVGAGARWRALPAWLAPVVLALAGCTGGVVVEENGPAGVSAGTGPGTSGTDPASGGTSGQGGSMVPSTGGDGTSASVGGMGSGGNSAQAAGGSMGSPVGCAPAMECTTIAPGHSPQRLQSAAVANTTAPDLWGRVP